MCNSSLIIRNFQICYMEDAEAAEFSQRKDLPFMACATRSLSVETRALTVT